MNELSVRTQRILQGENLTIYQANSLKDWELLRIPHVGRKTIKEIREAAIPHEDYELEDCG